MRNYFPQRERTDLLYIDGLLTKLDDITSYKANKPENEPIVRRFKQARSLLANGTKLWLAQGDDQANQQVVDELNKYALGIIHTKDAEKHTNKMWKQEKEFREAAVKEHGEDMFLDMCELVVQNFCKRCDGSLRETMEGGCPAYKCFVALDIGTMDDKHPKCVYAYREA